MLPQQSNCSLPQTLKYINKFVSKCCYNTLIEWQNQPGGIRKQQQHLSIWMILGGWETYKQQQVFWIANLFVLYIIGTLDEHICRTNL